MLAMHYVGTKRRAAPRSQSFAMERPLSIKRRMFAGLRSKWATFSACRAAVPAHAPAARLRSRRAGILVPAARRLRWQGNRLSPATCRLCTTEPCAQIPQVGKPIAQGVPASLTVP